MFQPTNYRAQKSAHDLVSVDAATRLQTREPRADWPVSGDQTTWDYGKRGLKALTETVDIWKNVRA